MLEEWERDWLRGGDVALGMFVSGQVVGSCGLHGRIGPGGLEIGYWTHPSFLREREAPAEVGIECRWRLTRQDWSCRTV
jgi:RimJ/RimL family protein N-acetyltransferase